jgi:hypothetical protein
MTMISSIMATIIFVVAAPAATGQFGISGLAVATLISTFAGEAYLWLRFHTVIIGSSVTATLVKCFAKPFVASCAALGIAGLVDAFLLQHAVPTPLALVANVVVSTAVFSISYLLVSHLVRLPLSRLVMTVLEA